MSFGKGRGINLGFVLYLFGFAEGAKTLYVQYVLANLKGGVLQCQY